MPMIRINDEKYIETLFNGLSKQKKVPMFLFIQDKQHLNTMTFSYKKKGTLNLLIENKDDLFLHQDINFDVAFVHEDVLFQFNTSVVESKETQLVIQKPTSIFTNLRRLVKRYKVSEDENFYIEFEKYSKKFHVADISIKGLAFVSDEKFLFEGQQLIGIKIIMPDGSELYMDGEVRHCKDLGQAQFSYGIIFSEGNLSLYQKLFSYILQRTCSDFKNLNDSSIEEINNLYDSSKELTFKTTDTTDEAFIEKVSSLYKLKDKPSIFASIMHFKGDKLVNIGSILRIYNRTFLNQELLSTPEAQASPKAKSNMLIALADTMINHPYFEHCIIYNNDFSSNAMFEKIKEFTNDNERILVDELEHYECNIGEFKNSPPYPPLKGANDDAEQLLDGYDIMALKKPDQFIKYCKKNLQKLEINCYDYESELFDLSKIKEVYESLGLFASRKLWVVHKDSDVVAFVVAESYSEDVGRDGFNDGARIYFVPSPPTPLPYEGEGGLDVDAVLATALPILVRFYKRNGKKKFNVFTPSGTSCHLPQEEGYEGAVAERLRECGLTHKGSIQRVIMNTGGVLQLKKLLATNFEYYTKYYPLSHPQKAIWYMEKVYPGTSIGNVAGTLRIKGEIDYNLLEMAINIFIEKNDAMRLRIVEEDGEPKQYIAKHKHKEIELLDFSEKSLEEYYLWEEQQTQIPFNLTDSDLFYFALIKINENNGGIYVNANHMIVDAWSISLMGNQIMEYYHALKNNSSLKGINNSASYIDYILNEEEYKYSNKFIKSKQFWSTKFDSIPEFTALKPHTVNYTNVKAERKTFVVSKEMASKLRDYSKQSHNSVFALFLAIMYVYVYRITMKKDIVLGTPILNRSTVKEKETIGMFISTMPVRINIDDNSSFGEFIQLVSKELMAFLKNQKYPYEFILSDYRKATATSDVLYDTVVSYQNASFEKDIQDNYTTRWHFNHSQIEALILHINDRDGEGQFILNFDYRVDLFSEDEVSRMYEHFMNLLLDAVESPNKKVYELEILSEWERNKLLYEFNDTYADYPKDKTVHQLFEEQVERTPDNVAVVFEEKELTYRELNGKANQLARVLREKGVKPDDIVGIMVERSLEMIIGILAILKAGGAYLPIDPEYPEDRIKYMLEDSKTKILLTQESLANKIEFDGECIVIDKDELYKGDDTNLKIVNKPKDLIYVIYTSGSTGKPKGVMLEHRNITNFIKGVTDRIPFNHDDVILCITTISFDIFVLETWLPLSMGIKIILTNRTEQLDIKKLTDLIFKNNVSMLQMTPSRANLVLEDDRTKEIFNKIKTFMIGGEAFSLSLLKTLKSKTSAKIYNMYGPTETAVWSSIKDLNNEEIITLGNPIANTKLHVLDNKRKLQSIGIPGELCIAGDGLARGYLNRPDLTTEKFIDNPFDLDTKIYKTGDLVRWLPDGNIEFLGRIDNQVKIRGFRIELGEIENQLLSSCKDIKEAAVIAKKDSTEKPFLCAYYSCGTELSINELKSNLQKCLPDYMIPSFFVRLEKMPLTPNGKINKKALEDFDIIFENIKNYEAPSNDTEKTLAKILQKMFNINNISISESFFDLGLDSLNTITFISKISKELNFKIAVDMIFKYPNIKELSKAIENLINSKNKASKTQLKKTFNSPYVNMQTNSIFDLILSERLPKIDSVALAYLPDDLIDQYDDDKNKFISTIFKDNFIFLNYINADLGNIGLILLPLFASELYSEKERLVELSTLAIEAVQKLGAKVVSLTGLIPSATSYGQDISDKLKTSNIKVTTGHTTTAASVVLSLERMLVESNRSLSEENLCVLGLGSIGTSVLELLLNVLPHPKSIILCDVFSKIDSIKKLADALKEKTGYSKNIKVVSSDRKVPSEIYESSLIIGATNVPDIININRLKPGTMIIDDSAPHCFSKEKAISRFSTFRDILFTEGGVLESPKSMYKTTYLPPELNNVSFETYERALVNESEITGCILSGLLSSKYDFLKPVIGNASSEDCVANYYKLKELGFKGAPLHCENFVLERRIIEEFCRKYSNAMNRL